MLDPKVVTLAIKGNSESIIDILRFYEKPLYRIAFSYLHNEHDALEAIQELSYRCFRSIQTVKQPAYIGTWLTRLIINICNDMLRKRKRELLSFEQVEQAYEDSYDVEWHDALTILNDEQRELIYLKYMDDYSNKKIAETMQIPEGTVKSRLHYILHKLKTVLREEG